MNRYLVTGQRPVFDRAPGEEVEAELTADQEAAWVSTGRLTILPRAFRVVGPLQVHDTDPGGTFERALTIPQERALTEAGHIERVPATTTAKKKPGDPGGKKETD